MARCQAGRNDAFSVFLHEIGHGLGIIYTGDDPSFTGTTPYDTFVQNGTFTGSNAEAAYQALFGSLTGLPLQSGSLSHLSESSNLGGDLMSPVLATGTNVGISAVDLGILQDIGVPIRLATSGDDVLHAVANVVLHLGAGNDTGYAIATGSTIYGEDGNDTLIGGAGLGLFSMVAMATISSWAAAAMIPSMARRATISPAITGLASELPDYPLCPPRSVQITDLRSGSPDGTDTLYNVEQAQWGDGSITYLSIDRPPVVTTSNLNAYPRPGDSRCQSLFSVSDPDGDAIQQYQLWDSTRDPNSGYFALNGIAQAGRHDHQCLGGAQLVQRSISWPAPSVTIFRSAPIDGFAWSAGRLRCLVALHHHGHRQRPRWSPRRM